MLERGAHRVLEAVDDQEALGIEGTEVRPAETPDFLLLNGSSTIGIEVTDFIRGQSDQGSVRREVEMQHTAVLRVAQTSYKRVATEPLIAHALWHSQERLTRRDADRLSVAGSSDCSAG
jgi:hypothetical protein